MMKLRLLFALLAVYCLIVPSEGKAQINQVLNPSFEEYTSCPTNINQIRHAKYWSSIDTFHYTGIDSFGHPQCAAEYCNECATYDHVTIPNSFSYHHYAHTGKGMIQNVVYVSTPTIELVNFSQGKLKRALTNGTSYCVTFYVLQEPSSAYHINRIGAYFDNGTIDTVSNCDTPILIVTPQIEYDSFIYDSVNWTKIQGSFVANGTESFITLGDFYYQNSTDTIGTFTTWWHYFLGGGGANTGATYYLIDDVSVIPITAHAYAGHDTSIALHDSVWVGNQDGYLPCYWYKNGVLVDSNVAGFWARPDTSCYYIMALDVCGNITRDTMHITVGHVGLQELHSPLAAKQNYRLYPNPSDGNITLEQVIPDNTPVTAVLYNALGMVESRTTLHFAGATDHMSIQNATPGVYLLQLRDASGKEYNLKFVIQ